MESLPHTLIFSLRFPVPQILPHLTALFPDHNSIKFGGKFGSSLSWFPAGLPFSGLAALSENSAQGALPAGPARQERQILAWALFHPLQCCAPARRERLDIASVTKSDFIV
jgi:hypothetical protein